MTIHRRLFEGVFDHAGKIRTYNITKKEWVLKGDTVIYASWNSIKDTLDYDFRTEKEFSYEGLSLNESIKHLVKFASDIWQIHPFADGNGRVGRLIMFKECLKYNIVPFIIEDNLKMFYYRGLKEWDNEKGYLTDTCLTAQDKYKAYLDYFRIGY